MQKTVKQLENQELVNIAGGGLYRIQDYDCNGNLMVYIWNSETGECTTLIGTTPAPC
ncbi:hypothetical protein KI659_06930 [Litoribacter alkaliphilus]|uniref:Bacteriocin n=1 Tax=Litoribacter ruber TaxID=702568 RepID=A0AAP2CI82_9BACT|nr:hypothetical protein [Litoribacter alkaliphilus]MBS9523751.1 hypothetical protein [Litoribacter alkaliphilus]